MDIIISHLHKDEAFKCFLKRRNIVKAVSSDETWFCLTDDVFHMNNSRKWVFFIDLLQPPRSQLCLVSSIVRGHISMKVGVHSRWRRQTVKPLKHIALVSHGRCYSVSKLLDARQIISIVSASAVIALLSQVGISGKDMRNFPDMCINPVRLSVVCSLETVGSRMSASLSFSP